MGPAHTILPNSKMADGHQWLNNYETCSTIIKTTLKPRFNHTRYKYIPKLLLTLPEQQHEEHDQRLTILWWLFDHFAKQTSKPKQTTHHTTISNTCLTNPACAQTYATTFFWYSCYGFHYSFLLLSPCCFLFFQQHLVVGLLSSHPWAPSRSLLDSILSDPRAFLLFLFDPQ